MARRIGTCHQQVVGLLLGDLSMIPAAQEIEQEQQKWFRQ